MYLLYGAVFTLLTIAKAEKWCCDQPADTDEYIARLVAFNNHNNDSIIDLADIQYDLDVRYDYNHDNKTSRMEYVLARNCLLGESFAWADFSFDQIDKNKDGYAVVGEFADAPNGRPPVGVSVFESTIRKMMQNAGNTGNIIGR